MHSYVYPHIYTLQLMSVYWIVQQVQYKCFDCHHHVLLFSLACIIMVHGTQKHPLSNLVVIQLRFLHTSIHGILFYHYFQWCVVFIVSYVRHFSPIWVFKSVIFICLDRSRTIFGLCLRFWINGCDNILLASKYSGWIINILFCI